MFKIIVSLIFVLSTLINSQAQKNLEGLPSVSSTFEKYKKNAEVLERLKVDYGITKPADCKFEMMDFYNSTEGKPSYWYDFTSDWRKQELNGWPDDGANLVFTITTPKNSEGVSYVLPFFVGYTRFNNNVITDSWHFDKWTIGKPISVIGKPHKADFYALLLENLHAIPFKINTGRTDDKYPDHLRDFCEIKSITESTVMDVQKPLSTGNLLIRYYIVSGTVQKVDESNAEVTHHENYSIQLAAKFYKDKASGSKWEFSGWSNSKCTNLDKGNETKSSTYNKQLSWYGFDEVYKKKGAAIPKPYWWGGSEKQRSSDLTRALILLEEDKEDSARLMLKNHIESTEIVDGWIAFAKNYKSKLCILNKNSIRVNPYSENQIMVIVKLERKSCLSDNGLKSKYKSAGMSKEQLKKGGYYTRSCSIKLETVVAEDGLKQWVVEFPKWDEEIPF